MTNGCESPHSTHCEFADAAADAAVKKTFAILGVNVDDPKDVSRFQDSLRFGERLRNLADHGAIAMWCAIVLFLVGTIGLGITMKVKGGP